MIRRIVLKVCAWTLLTLAVFVGAPVNRLMAQEVRYEYRATPEGEPKPLLIPCFVVDRFNFLCIETGDIFVNVAGGSLLPLTAYRAILLDLALQPQRTPSKCATDDVPCAKLGPSEIGGVSAFHAAATPSIILAHQKIASDAWVLAAQDRDAYQQWIHDNRPGCCDHRDCRPARVEWTPNGWRVEGADNLIDERQVIAWPFPTPYACVINRYARCLFLSSGG